MEEGNVIQGGARSDVQVTVSRPRRVLHFSDGVEEEMEEEHSEQLSAAPESTPAVDPKTLTWGPWLSHHMRSSGVKVVNAIDYAGEGLAWIFGITTPKYQIEINEHERMQEENRKMEEESAGWVPTDTDGQIPLVLSAPSKKEEKPTEV